MLKRVGAIRESTAPRSRAAPAVVEFGVGVAPHDGESVFRLPDKIGVAKREPGVSNQVRLRAKVAVVVQPSLLDIGIGKVLGLPLDGLLFAVRAIKGIDVGEELLRAWLRDVPRRVAENGIEAGPPCIEDVWKLQLPVEKALSHRQTLGCLHRVSQRRSQRRRKRRLSQVACSARTSTCTTGSWRARAPDIRGPDDSSRYTRARSPAACTGRSCRRESTASAPACACAARSCRSSWKSVRPRRKTWRSGVSES